MQAFHLSSHHASLVSPLSFNTCFVPRCVFVPTAASGHQKSFPYH